MMIRRTAISLIALTMTLSSPLVSAETCHIVADHATGHVFASSGADSPRQIASLTKIAAVLVLLEWLDETGIDAAERRVRVPAAALRGGANPLGLREGDEISIETGLFAAMMASDNTSIHALAEAVGREMDPVAKEGVAVFVGRMNRLAEQLGMKDTRFVNPHGLDEGSDFGVSTAADLARLAIRAHDHPAFGRLCVEKERAVSILREGTTVEVRLVNTNELVGSRGIDGTKTGTTRRSGPCLVATATRELSIGGQVETRRLVVVVLNSEDRFRDAVLLLDKAWPRCAEWLGAGASVDPKQSLRKGRE